jgi:hypothetical protein
MTEFQPNPRFLVVHPIADYAKEAKRLGFALEFYENEPKWQKTAERGWREVAVIDMRIVPITIRAREAMRRSSHDPLCQAYEVHHSYELALDPERAINEPRAVALQDAAVYVLNVAQNILREARRESRN